MFSSGTPPKTPAPKSGKASGVEGIKDLLRFQVFLIGEPLQFASHYVPPEASLAIVAQARFSALVFSSHASLPLLEPSSQFP